MSTSDRKRSQAARIPGKPCSSSSWRPLICPQEPTRRWRRGGGAATVIARLQQARVEADSTHTLGAMTGRFLESVLINQDCRPTEELGAHRQPFELSLRTSIQISGAHHDCVHAELKTLVQLRNELVHHFVERFALDTEAGCDAALAYLQRAYSHIEARCRELQGWGDDLHEARIALKARVESPAFADYLVYGIAPDGHIHWPAAGIVCALREAAAALSGGGWLPLSAAIDWIGQHRPEQQPGEYGCRQWPQVLHESRAFDFRYRPNARGPRGAWYRVRTVRPSLDNSMAEQLQAQACRELWCTLCCLRISTVRSRRMR